MAHKVKRSVKRQIQLNKTLAGVRKYKKCTSKKFYNSEQEAMAWGRFANERYNTPNRKWDVYYCSQCYKWHLSTTKE